MSWIELDHDCTMPTSEQLRAVGARRYSVWACPYCGQQWALSEVGETWTAPTWRAMAGTRWRRSHCSCAQPMAVAR